MKGWTLWFKLVLGGILIVVVPLLVTGIISAVKSSNALNAVAESQVVDTARQISDVVKLVLSEEMKIAVDLSSDPHTVQLAADIAKNGIGKAVAEVGSLDNKLTGFMTKTGNDYEGLFITDSNGTIYADGNGGGYKGIKIADREYFKTAKGGKVNVGDVIKSKKTDQTVVTVCAPIMSGAGEFLGALAVVIKLDFVANKVASVKIGLTGFSFMVDKSGLIIAHPKKELVFALNISQQDGLQEVAKNMLSLRTGSDSYVFQGVKKVVGYAPVEMTGWSIAVSQNADEFLGPAHAPLPGF